MRGLRPGKTGGVFAGIHGGFFRGENDADGRGSFAVVERSMSDRLQGIATIRRPAPGQHHSLHHIHGTTKSDRPILEIRLS